MTTSVAVSKSYILERISTDERNDLFWAVWLTGFYVAGLGTQPLRWVQRDTIDCYSKRMNIFTPATNAPQAFAVGLPRRSSFQSISWQLYRFD